MRRLGEEPYMNREMRDIILSQIATGRARQARFNSIMTTLPAWTDRPFRGDQDKVNELVKTYQAADGLVTVVESRLAGEPGPVWRDFNPDERQAFANWVGSLEKVQGYVDTYFPTDQQKRIMEYVCFAVAIGSFVLPLLLSDGESDIKNPFGLKPVPLPPGMKPRLPSAPGGGERPVFRPSISPGRQSFMPTSFSRIPSAAAPSGAIPVKAEVMRPAAGGPPPWRSQQTPPAGGLPSPGFRSFVKPLGPSEPITARTVDTAATGVPITQTPSSSHDPRIYPKPRFRSQ